MGPFLKQERRRFLLTPKGLGRRAESSMTVTKSDRPKVGALRVWWSPKIPMKTFYREVDDLSQARLILDTLASYDELHFQEAGSARGCNIGGVEVFKNGEWCEWYDDEAELDFWDWVRQGKTETPTMA